jgi:hypothetical protein
MAAQPRIIADGSATADSPIRREIDLSDPIDRRRYRCPYGHCAWDRTNSHIYCASCARHADQNSALSPEHYELYDAKEDETIPWAAVRIAPE